MMIFFGELDFLELNHHFSMCACILGKVSQPKRKNHKPRPTDNQVGSHGFSRFFMLVQKFYSPAKIMNQSVIHRTLLINECLNKKTDGGKQNSRLRCDKQVLQD